MTNLIASNSVTRRYLKRGELMAKRRAEAAQNEARKAECMSRVERATSLGSLRDKPAQEEIAKRKNRVYYKDSNPYGNKIHAVQKSRGKSTPLI
ncbi:TPA: regulator [Klebsiella oxytoca]|nr:regulator [Klebsiella oxytoca]